MKTQGFTFMGMLDGIVDFFAKTILLFLWVLSVPFVLAIYAIKHPHAAKMAVINFWDLMIVHGNTGTWCIVAFMILLLMLAPKTTHTFAKRTLQSLCVVGLGYWLFAAAFIY